MSRPLPFFGAIVIGMVAGGLITAFVLHSKYADELARREGAWLAEKSALNDAIDQGRNSRSTPREPGPAFPAPAARVLPSSPTPLEIVAKLRALPRADQPAPRVLRLSVLYFEQLIAAGPQALPAIREFLLLNEDIDLDLAFLGRGGRSTAFFPKEFVVPPSLRFGFFDAAKQIGGADAEKLLVDVLTTARRGVEVSWLAQTLHAMANNTYREQSLAVARQLLANPTPPASTSPLDRNDRDYLFNVLTMFGDTSFARTAQEQLLRADGQVDRSALKYLHQTLGPQAVPIAAQMFDDPRITDPGNKEPFARLALAFVGADAQANLFYERAINDLALTESHRKNLIEDLNQDGFADTRNLTERDLPLIENRMALIEKLAPKAADKANSGAFAEAYKDLYNMKARVTGQPAKR